MGISVRCERLEELKDCTLCEFFREVETDNGIEVRCAVWDAAVSESKQGERVYGET